MQPKEYLQSSVNAGETSPPSVGLFVTCLVDLFRPSVAFAAVELLQSAACDVDVPMAQTCCGQPAYNSGDDDTARAIAKNVIQCFESYDYVVAPSGSCAAMLSEHYPSLFANDAKWAERAENLAGRSHELVSFLDDVVGMDVSSESQRFDSKCTYHDSCSGLRELGVQEQPRRLLAGIEALELIEMKDSNVCCGFGGTFCVKYPDISSRMVMDKVQNVTASDADVLLGGDLGCLMNIAGRLSREASPIRVYHVAEVLSGLAGSTAPIAGTEKDALSRNASS